MGEANARRWRRAEAGETSQPQVVDTLGGRMHVRWDEGAAATPHGQLVFFAEFLAATGVFERWVSSARWRTAAATPRTSATCWAR